MTQLNQSDIELIVNIQTKLPSLSHDQLFYIDGFISGIKKQKEASYDTQREEIEPS